MVFGRSFRKLAAQGVAYAMFRWLAVWVLIVVCVNQKPSGELFAFVIIAVDIIAHTLYRSIQHLLVLEGRKAWFGRLTGRFLNSMTTQQTYEGSKPDFDRVSIDAAEAASKNILKADHREVGLGYLDSRAWHWFAGFLSFLWVAAKAILYYGTALYVGVQYSST